MTKERLLQGEKGEKGVGLKNTLRYYREASIGIISNSKFKTQLLQQFNPLLYNGFC
jgi:hypothetical protein